jgi:hypothetical protein
MMEFKTKKISGLLGVALLSACFVAPLAQAENYESGDIASQRAAEQKAALAKKAEKRRLKKLEEEAKKQAEGQQQAPAAQPDPAVPAQGQTPQ